MQTDRLAFETTYLSRKPLPPEPFFAWLQVGEFDLGICFMAKSGSGPAIDQPTNQATNQSTHHPAITLGIWRMGNLVQKNNQSRHLRI